MPNFLLRRAILRLAKQILDFGRTERTERPFEFTLFVIMPAAAVDLFIFQNCCAIIKQSIVPFTRRYVFRKRIYRPLRDPQNFFIRNILSAREEKMKIYTPDIRIQKRFA